MSNGKRVKRELVPMIVESFLNSTGLGHIPFMITGSFHRGRQDCGDIELMFILRDFADRDSVNHSLYKHFGSCINGNPKTRGIFGEVSFDIFTISRGSEGPMILHTTGSGEFNRAMRQQANERGYKLNQYGLWRLDSGVCVCCTEKEEDIFTYLGIDYIKPEDRSI
jgi:DNA polymerase/3'-5' exonuclease PolX